MPDQTADRLAASQSPGTIPDEEAYGCCCGDEDCPECGRSAKCHYCQGEGWGFNGTTWDNDDPINEPDGEVQTCPCCGGSGNADDCTFW